MNALLDGYLVFLTSGGELVPACAKSVIDELASGQINEETLCEAADLLLYHFQVDLQRESVTVNEFSDVLVMYLEKIGYKVTESANVGYCARPDLN
jgi:hypothetical protein